jgi:hypothetical protein
MTPNRKEIVMDEIFENPYVAPIQEKPWTKLQVVASTAIVFSVACVASVAADKAITKLFKM